MLEGGQPGLIVGEDQLEGDCLVEDGQLGGRGNPFSFCELQPLSCLSQAAWDLSFWGEGGHGELFQLDVQGDGQPLLLQLDGDGRLCQLLVDEESQLCYLVKGGDQLCQLGEGDGLLQKMYACGLLVHLHFWILLGVPVVEGVLDLPWPDEDDGGQQRHRGQHQQVQGGLPHVHALVHFHIPSQVLLSNQQAAGY